MQCHAVAFSREQLERELNLPHGTSISRMETTQNGVLLIEVVSNFTIEGGFKHKGERLAEVGPALTKAALEN